MPTRFVQKCTLRAQLEPSGPHEAVEGRTGNAGELGDGKGSIRARSVVPQGTSSL